MRNIQQYPLTDEEIFQWLNQKIAEEEASQRVGGMDGLILQALKSRVQNNPLEPDEIMANLHN